MITPSSASPSQAARRSASASATRAELGQVEGVEDQFDLAPDEPEAIGLLALDDDDLSGRLTFSQNAAGAVPAPFDCYLVLRGVKTLAVRMERHCANALAVARFLRSLHPDPESQRARADSRKSRYPDA